MADQPLRCCIRKLRSACTGLGGPVQSTAWRGLFILAVVVLIVMKLDLGAVSQLLRGFDLLHAIGMLGVSLALLTLFAWRWQLIANELGYVAGYRQFLRALWLSQAAGELGPALVVGELTRFKSMQGQGDRGSLLLSQAVDRWSGKVVLLVLVIALLPAYLPLYGRLLPPVNRPAAAMMLLLAGGIGLIGLYQLWRRWPGGRGYAARVFAVCNPLLHPGHYAVSLLIQGLLITNLVLAASGLGLDAQLGKVMLAGPLLLLGIGLLPGLISDWGKREATVVMLLAPAGLLPEQSLAISLLFGLSHLLSALPGVFLLTRLNAAKPGAE
ncbi:MAG: lysylphosphatidylglycerol synthase domain-containing protein [Methylococcaceae bacterium]